MAGLSVEQRRALAIAAARKRASSERPDRMRGVGLINEGIARTGDAMAGPLNRGINRGLEAAGFDARLNEQPFAGVMDATGVARRDDPEGLGERALVGAGEAAGALLPAAGILGAAGRLGGVAGGAANTMRGALATRTGVAAELAAGAGAGVGGELAGRATEGNALAEAGGALAGGLAAGVGVGSIPRAVRGAGDVVMRTPLAGTAIRTAGSVMAPFTRRGAQVIAEDTVRGATADRFAAAERLADPNVGGLSVAQQTGDEGIMGIERAVAAADPQFRSRLNAQIEGSRATLQGETSAPAQGRSPRDLRQFFAERQDRHRQTVGRYVQQAERRLDARMRDIQPGRQREEASIWATREIDTAFNRASAEEARLWQRVPRTAKIGTSQARVALREALEETTEVSADSIPGKALRFLGDGDNALGDTASMGQLHRLYSEMRKAGREAMAKPVPDEFAARQSNRIAEGILADIEAAEGTTNAARLLADARAYSREMAEQFGQGNVARIMARTRAGDERIPDGQALRSTIGQPREAGGVAVDDIRRAAGPAAETPMQDFMRDEFLMNATRPDGTPDPAAVERFTRTNREALARFPGGVEQEVMAVRGAARDVVRRRDRMQTILDGLGETQRGTVAGMVNAPKGREIARGIFEADNPAAAARTIARAAQRDGTGDAYLGLKAGLYDEVIRRSGDAGAINGERMLRTLNDPEMNRVLRAALPPGEMSRLRTIAGQFRKIERSLSAQRVDTENLPNTLISTFVQIQAAKGGRALGTGTIQVPGMFVGRAREIVSRAFNDRADALIRAALEDPRLMSDLLIGPSASQSRQREAANRVMNWAVGALAASGDTE